MYTNTFKHTKQSADCRYCIYSKLAGKTCCLRFCPYIKEKIEANAISYAGIIRQLCREFPELRPRLVLLPIRFSKWESADHKKRMDWLKISNGYNHKRNTPAYYATMYLLTADADLYRRTRNCFNRRNIDFGAAMLRGISEQGYILLMAAKCIYKQEDKLTLEDMQNPDVIDDDSFRLIVNAHLIARHGLSFLRIRKG